MARSLAVLVSVLVALLALSLPSVNAQNVEDVRGVLLGKWREHLSLRSNITYKYRGEYLLPRDSKDVFERKSAEIIRQTGERPLAYEDYSYGGRYFQIDGRQRFETKCVAMADDAVLSDSVAGTLDGKMARIGDHKRRSVRNGSAAEIGRHVLNPETAIRNLRCPSPLETWLKTADFKVRETTDGEGHPCLALNETWEAEDPTAKDKKWTFSVEVWFDKSRGYLPCKYITGPRLLNGHLYDGALVTEYLIEEIAPGRFLLAGFDAETFPQDSKKEKGKWSVALTDIRIGDDAKPPDSWLSNETGLRDHEQELLGQAVGVDRIQIQRTQPGPERLTPPNDKPKETEPDKAGPSIVRRVDPGAAEIPTRTQGNENSARMPQGAWLIFAVFSVCVIGVVLVLFLRRST